LISTRRATNNFSSQSLLFRRRVLHPKLVRAAAVPVSLGFPVHHSQRQQQYQHDRQQQQDATEEVCGAECLQEASARM
jgi:hypothetical protein